MLIYDDIKINVQGSVTIHKLKEIGYECKMGDNII